MSEPMSTTIAIANTIQNVLLRVFTKAVACSTFLLMDDLASSSIC